MAPRRYEQRLRADAAEETRRRILDTVYEQLRDEPSRPVGVDRVARAAGVARSTVYLVFGSRTGLFEALAADLRGRTGFAAMMQRIAQDDAAAQLCDGLREGAMVYARHRDVVRVLWSMAQLDPDAVGGTVDAMEDNRRSDTVVLIRRVAEQGGLRAGITEDDAVDTLWLLAGFDGFDQLYTGRGLPAERVGDVLVGIAERAILR